MPKSSRIAPWLAIVALIGPARPLAIAEEPSLRAEARAALDKAATCYRTRAASHGGYVYYYAPDLSRRWGEGEATLDQVWVQPPGTPAVGLAFLAAFEATGDRAHLDAARDAARALVYGQLRSGGWTNSIDFDPEGSRVAQYRVGKGRGKDNSTLDDGITPAALRLLMHVDRALGFDDRPIHEAARIGLDALLAAQFPNGGFPQVWTGPVAPRPVVPARYPGDDWRAEGKVKNYWDMYTLNDDSAADALDALLDAIAIYRDDRAEAAARRLGRFFLLAQMPDPQPAWAQQYDEAMRPIWARKFEPPAIAGRESQGVIEALLKLHRHTGDAAYLEPIPRALAYLKRSLLPDGRLARYYELKSNRPLYMTRKGDDYSLTYDDSALPDHYGWKTASRIDELEAEYRAQVGHTRSTPVEPSPPDPATVRAIIAGLDEEGRWLSIYWGGLIVGQPKFKPGYEYISSEVFSDNLKTLSAYLKANPGDRELPR